MFQAGSSFIMLSLFFFQIRQAATTNYFQDILNKLGKYAHALELGEYVCLSGCLSSLLSPLY
jgi:hypothetical protein